jgi:UDP:flavonoid glycosyltransferase YjiC (YdhE family)
LVTAGLALDPAVFRVPANTVIESYIPHQQVFPQADLVITHGGHGTVITALAHGVPVICLPMGRDQGDIAARVVWHGAGLRLTSHTRPATLRRAVQRVLAEPHFRDAARRLANDLRHADGGATAVAELEGLADVPARRPSATLPQGHRAAYRARNALGEERE